MAAAAVVVVVVVVVVVLFSNIFCSLHCFLFLAHHIKSLGAIVYREQDHNTIDTVKHFMT